MDSNPFFKAFIVEVAMGKERNSEKPEKTSKSGNVSIPVGQRPFRRVEEQNLRMFGYRRIVVEDGELIAIC